MIAKLKKSRRAANLGLYGSIAVILVTIVFHFSPVHIAYQQENVRRWMLIAGTILAVLAIVMVLMSIRRTVPMLRQMDKFEEKLAGYTSYICNLYSSTFFIVLIECALIVLMTDTSLLMVTILLVLVLFLSYPNMYKIKSDLGLTDAEMTALFGDAYTTGTSIADAQPDISQADVHLEIEAQSQEIEADEASKDASEHPDNKQ